MAWVDARPRLPKTSSYTPRSPGEPSRSRPGRRPTGDDEHMDVREMNRLIDIHLTAEQAADSAMAVSIYTDDVEQDVVGMPDGTVYGRGAARNRYEVEEMRPPHQYCGEKFCVLEHLCTSTLPWSMFGVPGNGRRVSFRILHVGDFSDGRISREKVCRRPAGRTGRTHRSRAGHRPLRAADGRQAFGQRHEVVKRERTPGRALVASECQLVLGPGPPWVEVPAGGLGGPGRRWVSV